MNKSQTEWFKQAEYDMESAQAMFAAGRYIYTIFLCHLAIEKALKGILAGQGEQLPPKTHNLIYLVELCRLALPEEISEPIFFLNRLSIPTRYPDDLEKLQREFSRKRSVELLQRSREVLKWLKEKSGKF